MVKTDYLLILLYNAATVEIEVTSLTKKVDHAGIEPELHTPGLGSLPRRNEH